MTTFAFYIHFVLWSLRGSAALKKSEFPRSLSHHVRRRAMHR